MSLGPGIGPDRTWPCKGCTGLKGNRERGFLASFTSHRNCVRIRPCYLQFVRCQEKVNAKTETSQPDPSDGCFAQRLQHSSVADGDSATNEAARNQRPNGDRYHASTDGAPDNQHPNGDGYYTPADGTPSNQCANRDGHHAPADGTPSNQHPSRDSYTTASGGNSHITIEASDEYSRPGRFPIFPSRGTR